jgi:hypothetical protein
MPMIWTPEHVFFLAAVGVVIAVLIIGEMLEARRSRALVLARTDGKRREAATSPLPTPGQLEPWRLRALPRAAREGWRRARVAKAARRAAID